MLAPTARLKAPLGGELSPKVTEGWLGEVRAPGATPHRLAAELPSEGSQDHTATVKPPLCKGRWHAGAEGLWPYEGRSMYGQGHNPSVCAIAQPAPFTQGSLPSTPIEFLWPRSVGDAAPYI